MGSPAPSTRQMSNTDSLHGSDTFFTASETLQPHKHLEAASYAYTRLWPWTCSGQMYERVRLGAREPPARNGQFYINIKKWVIGVLIIHNFRTQRFTLYSLNETQHRSTVRRVVQRKYPMSYIGKVSRGPRRQEHLVLAGQIGHGHERTRGV